MPEAAPYNVNCHACGNAFDAMEATFCSCIVNEGTLLCPSCLTCFCKGPSAYKQKFWREAPKALWDRKFSEMKADFVAPPNPEPVDVKRPLVLIVDDEKPIQKVAVRVIESLGYGIVLGRNGEEGLELAKRYKPELVLTDALMPKLDGREMGLRIKNDPATAHVKVVVMTSLYTNVKYQTEGIRLYKADDYLSKPLDLNQLRAVLQKHLG